MVAEQTFSWFRNFAFTLNSMRPLRHEFLVHHYCRIHNEQVDAGDIRHLTPAVRLGRRQSVPYTCSKGKKVIKAMKAK